MKKGLEQINYDDYWDSDEESQIKEETIKDEVPLKKREVKLEIKEQKVVKMKIEKPPFKVEHIGVKKVTKLNRRLISCADLPHVYPRTFFRCLKEWMKYKFDTYYYHSQDLKAKVNFHLQRIPFATKAQIDDVMVIFMKNELLDPEFFENDIVSFLEFK